MGTILLYGTNLAVNLRLNVGTILIYGTNLAVNLRLNMGTIQKSRESFVDRDTTRDGSNVHSVSSLL